MRPAPLTLDVDAATEFMLRRRGRVRARLVLGPAFVSWAASFAIAVVIGRSHRGEYVPFFAALYGCVGFFMHAYTLAWRSGALIWRYLALLVCLLLFSALSVLLADDAGAWTLYSGDRPYSRLPAPGLFWSVSLNTVSMVFLVLHGLFLGTGSHAPVMTRARDLVAAAVGAAPAAQPHPAEADGEG